MEINWFLIIKFAVSAGLIVLISEVGKVHAKTGAFIGAMPWVTTITMVWLFIGLHSQPAERTDKIADHAWYTFWYVLPTMPMFLLIPWMLRRGCNFYVTMGASAALTLVCFGALGLALRRFDIHLW